MPTPNTIPDTLQPEQLPDAMLLAATGGLLDAVVYLNHGHVFANAMTGNIILFSIAATEQNWMQAVRHLVPLGGFLAGVVSSKHMRFRLGQRSAQVGLAFEIVALFAVGWLPSTFPGMAFTAIVAYVAAFQVASFRKVDRFAYNSTFITGNLRDMAEGICEATIPAANIPAVTPAVREEGLAKFRALGLICLSFLFGTLLGAWAAPRFGNHSFWIAEPFLLTVVFITFPRPSPG
jgi:uncharacterized membrane protein YoaK (UPF0700 family)